MKSIYYNTKTDRFEELSRSTCAYKIMLSKAILDAHTVKSWENGAGNTVYAAVVDGEKFAYVKQDELLLPEYSKGMYRVSHGEFWTPGRGEEAFVCE